MEVLIHSKSDVEHQVEIIVPPVELQPHFDKAYREEGRNISIPGFRRGKVPIQIIKQRFGRAIEYQVVEKLSNEFFQQTMEERSIKPIGKPVLEEIDYSPGERLMVKVKYETAPDVVAKDYKGIQLERYNHIVSDDEIEEEIKYLRNSKRILEEAEKADEEGYLVTCAIQILDESGFPVIGKRNENAKIDLGDERVNRDLKAELLNMKTGEEKDIEITHEGTTGEEETERARVYVKKIERIILPELTDEFAKSVLDGKADTVDDLYQLLREELENLWEERYNSKLRQDLMSEIVKRNPVTVPPSILNDFLEEDLKEIRNRRPEKDLPENFDIERYKNAHEPSYIASAQWIFLREGIAEQENIKVLDLDFEEKAEENSERFGLSKEQLQKFYQSNQQIIASIMNEKIIQFLINHADVKDVNDNDLMQTAMAPLVDQSHDEVHKELHEHPERDSDNEKQDESE